MPTFADFGIPFPLFEADTSTASEYRGLGQCSLCRTDTVHCFELSIGSDIIAKCSRCGSEVALDADDRANATCPACMAPVSFPKLDEAELVACYDCLRAGHAALSKDTQIGMVRWEDAQKGVTRGVPGLLRCDFETVPTQDGWHAARVFKEHLLELVRTPTYSTIQGERWRFCCRYPMTFIGRWEQNDFEQHSPDGGGRKLFDQIVEDPEEGLWEDELHDITGIYVFVCKRCKRMTAHWDIA